MFESRAVFGDKKNENNVENSGDKNAPGKRERFRSHEIARDRYAVLKQINATAENTKKTNIENVLKKIQSC